MDIISFSIKKPVTVIVGVILVVLFGYIGLKSLPYQLTPDVTAPEITVKTIWVGATPYEIEKEIIEEQEEVLKGIRGLTLLESHCYNGLGTVSLTFKIGTNLDTALLRVSNKLNEVPEYPENVEKPVIEASGASSSPVIWLTLKTLPGSKKDINAYKTYFEDEIRQYIERVEGVSDLLVFGGRDTEIHINADPAKLAAYHMTIGEVGRKIREQNANTSAGFIDVGKKSYRMRTVGQFKKPKDIYRVVLKESGDRRVFVRDVATVTEGYSTLHESVMQNLATCIAIGIKKEPGANVLTLTREVRKTVNELNRGKLKEKGLYLDWVYDQTPYIQSAINLVRQNIYLGGALAIIVLLIFLRSATSTLVVATAIPISAIGTFIFMWLMGRNLNVVSLSGISFAVGMLVDNAIVVLENIDRHWKQGKSPFKASLDGTKEVWGAVLASTVTTVAVFLPVIFLKEEAGQLFRDIAIAVTFSVSLSLVVSITVIPMLSSRLYSWFSTKKETKPGIDLLTRLGNKLITYIVSAAKLCIKNPLTRLSTVFSLTILAILSVVLLIPKMEYLPQGNRNLVMGILIPPPGYSYDERNKIGKYIFKIAKPYFEQSKDGIPKIRNLFFVASERFTLFGIVAEDMSKARLLLPLGQRIVKTVPGVFGIVMQRGIFESRLGRGRTVVVNIAGHELLPLVKMARAMYGMILKTIPGSQVRPVPSLEISYPQTDFVPDLEKLSANKLSVKDLGVAIDVLVDGRKIDEFKREGLTSLDIILTSGDKYFRSPEEVANTLIATPTGKLLPVSSLAKLVYTQGLTEIYHMERKRTFSLEVTPPSEVPVQKAMEIIKSNVVEPLKNAGKLKDMAVFLGGVADKLTQARLALQGNFLLAAIIIYLLMSALFENFLYPFIIIFSVPLAAAGGVIGLKLVNMFIAPQPLDILTMLGFVILIGVVVNNAILIVHQTLNNVRYEGMGGQEAILESVRTRIRPIFMSAITSIFGMLPLVIAPGAGSELYRGLGSVVLGGLALSTVFTLFVIPSLLAFFVKRRLEGEQEK